MKIGIISPSTVSIKSKIVKDFIFKLKSEFGKHIIICSGGNSTGIERDVKKYALEFELSYLEFNPAFTAFNMYSAMPVSYYFKKFHKTHLFSRYREMIWRIDKLIIVLDGENKFYKSIADLAIKNGKSVVIL